METNGIWNECLDWLVELRLFSEGQITTWEDLARHLRSGVKLCELLHLIDKSLIDTNQVCYRTANSKLQCLRNIQLFLDVCVATLKIKRNLLCNAEDVFNLENYETVWKTFSEISQTDLLLSRNIRSFPRSQSTPEDLDRSFSCVLYSNVGNEDTPEDELYDVVQDDFATEYGDMETEDDTYSFLVGYQVQSIFPEVYQTQIENPQKSDFVHQELLKSEKIFAEGLFIMDELVKQRLVDLIGKSDAERIVYRFNELKLLHKALYEQLYPSFPRRFSVIEETFRNFENWFITLYGDYCSRYKDTIAHLKQYTSRYEDVSEKIQEMEDTVLGKKRLDDYLAHPFQRICKYPLLISVLLSSLEKEHPIGLDDTELVSLRKTLNVAKNINDFVNSAIGDEDYKKMFRESTFDNFYEVPANFQNFEQTGRMKMEVEALISNIAEKRVKQENGYLFLFEEAILVCKVRKQRKVSFPSTFWFAQKEVNPLHFLNTIPIRHLMVHQYEDEATFTLTDTRTEDKTAITVKPPQSKDEVLRKINYLCSMDGHRSESKHQFSSVTLKFQKDNEFTCSICRRLLVGTYCQGYMCDNCKYICHNTCIEAFNEYKCFYHALPAIDEVALNAPWWKGTKTNQDSASLLSKRDPGTFLIRWSEKTKAPVLTVIDEKLDLLHVVINFCDGKFYLKDKRNESTFVSLQELVHFYSDHSLGLAIDMKLPSCSLSECNSCRRMLVSNPNLGHTQNYLSTESQAEDWKSN